MLSSGGAVRVTSLVISPGVFWELVLVVEVVLKRPDIMAADVKN